jgi:hypothetical protein
VERKQNRRIDLGGVLLWERAGFSSKESARGADEVHENSSTLANRGKCEESGTVFMISAVVLERYSHRQKLIELADVSFGSVEGTSRIGGERQLPP